eukprot:16517_1
MFLLRYVALWIMLITTGNSVELPTSEEFKAAENAMKEAHPLTYGYIRDVEEQRLQIPDDIKYIVAKYSQKVIVDQELPNGDRYTGEFKLNESGKAIRHGHGTLRQRIHDVSSGYWVEGYKYWTTPGDGKCGFLDGSIDDGDFKDGELEDGMYLRNFSDDFTHMNTYNCAYKGHWKEGKKHGYGTEKFPDSTLFKCKFKDGKRNGEGVYIFPSGIIRKGTWKNGILQRESH